MTPTPRTEDEAEYWTDPAMSGEHQIVPADFARQLERELADEREQLAANHEATKLLGKWLEAERALADRLAESLDRTLQLMAESGDSPPEAEIDLAAWKEARSGTV